MKKILFLSLFFLAALIACNNTTVNAQVPTQPEGDLTITGATLSNTDTAYARTPAIHGKGSLAVTVTVTKTSGTASGSAFMFVSNDADHWEQWSASDSMSLASPITYDGVVSKTYTFKVPITYWTYYEVRAIQGGTAVNVFDGWYKFAKDNGMR